MFQDTSKIVKRPKYQLSLLIISYGERFQTSFWMSFFVELGEQFTLVDDYNNKIIVKFNQSPYHLLLTVGCLCVQGGFRIGGNKLILF